MERLKCLLSHVDPHLTLGQLMARLVREGLDRHDPARPPRGRRTGARVARARAAGAEQTAAAKASAQAAAQPGDEAAAPLETERGADRPDTSAAKPATETTSAAKTRRLGRQAAACAKPAAPPRTQTSAAKAGGGRGRAIPAAVKRAVWRRDRGRCSYVDRTSGRRYGSQHLLQIDHVVPYACGGAEPTNLRLLCAAHHRHAGFGRPGEDRPAPVPFSPRCRRRKLVIKIAENISTEAMARARQLALQRGVTLGEIASELILTARQPEEAPPVRNGERSAAVSLPRR